MNNLTAKPRKALSDYIRFHKMISGKNTFLGVNLFGLHITLIIARP